MNNLSEEEKKAIEILKWFKDNEIQRDKLEIDNRCGGWKIGRIYKSLELNTAIETVLNLLEKKDKQIEELKEIDEKRTWTVNNVIAEYIPDYELISLVNRYKDESFIPRVEVEKILNDRKK